MALRIIFHKAFQVAPILLTPETDNSVFQVAPILLTPETDNSVGRIKWFNLILVCREPYGKLSNKII